MLTFFEKLNELLDSVTPFVMVTVVDTTGSVPQDAGSKMLVTEAGLHAGTVGGGKVEARAIKEAMILLQSVQSRTNRAQSDNGNGKEGAAANGRRHNPPSTLFFSWSLDKDIGMTCGGSVRMYMEAFNLAPWRIVIFGAGHLACALLSLLKQLDCQIICYDTREEWIAKLPQSRNIKKILVESLPDQVKDLKPGDSVCLMSMGHSTDMPVLLEILKRDLESSFAYLGVIGSAAKAARLRKDIIDAGLPEEKFNTFSCPMGLPIGSNNPHEIAISISAQLLQMRDKSLAAQRRYENSKEGALLG